MPVGFAIRALEEHTGAASKLTRNSRGLRGAGRDWPDKSRTQPETGTAPAFVLDAAVRDTVRWYAPGGSASLLPPAPLLRRMVVSE